MEYLFSYGTLQQKNVQLENFGRILKGSKDVLQKYIVKELEIADEHVLRLSNKKFIQSFSLQTTKRMKLKALFLKLLQLNY